MFVHEKNIDFMRKHIGLDSYSNLVQVVDEALVKDILVKGTQSDADIEYIKHVLNLIKDSCLCSSSIWAEVLVKRIAIALGSKLNKEYQDILFDILVSGDPDTAVSFALYYPWADLSRCQEVACQDSFSALSFATKVPGADVEKCIKAFEDREELDLPSLFSVVDKDFAGKRELFLRSIDKARSSPSGAYLLLSLMVDEEGVFRWLDDTYNLKELVEELSLTVLSDHDIEDNASESLVLLLLNDVFENYISENLVIEIVKEACKDPKSALRLVTRVFYLSAVDNHFIKFFNEDLKKMIEYSVCRDIHQLTGFVENIQWANLDYCQKIACESSENALMFAKMVHIADYEYCFSKMTEGHQKEFLNYLKEEREVERRLEEYIGNYG